MHLRTKRKPTQKNISKLIFSVLLTFIIIAAVFSLGNIKKENFGFKSVNQEDKKQVATSTIEPKEFWTLDVQSILTTPSGDKIFVDIASTSAEQEQGLSGKDKLMLYVKNQKIETEGMLFVFFKPTVLNFWMKDMNFNLDMIWMDENFKIVHIVKNALASSYDKENPANSTIYSNGNKLAKYVLEINAGLSDQLNLKEGDTLVIQ